MNIDTAYLIILILTNIGTYYLTKKATIEHTIDVLEREDTLLSMTSRKIVLDFEFNLSYNKYENNDVFSAIPIGWLII